MVKIWAQVEKISQRSIPDLSRALDHGLEVGCNGALLLWPASQYLHRRSMLLWHLFLYLCLYVGGAGNDGRGLCHLHKRLTQFHIFSSVVNGGVFNPPSNTSAPHQCGGHKDSSVWSTVGLWRRVFAAGEDVGVEIAFNDLIVQSGGTGGVFWASRRMWMCRSTDLTPTVTQPSLFKFHGVLKTLLFQSQILNQLCYVLQSSWVIARVKSHISMTTTTANPNNVGGFGGRDHWTDLPESRPCAPKDPPPSHHHHTARVTFNVCERLGCCRCGETEEHTQNECWHETTSYCSQLH